MTSNLDNKKNLEIIRHDCAHVLAEAVQSLYPDTLVSIGPTIENGFYYDFEREKPFTSEDLNHIEKSIKPNTKLIAINFPNNPTGKLISSNKLIRKPKQKKIKLKFKIIFRTSLEIYFFITNDLIIFLC